MVKNLTRLPLVFQPFECKDLVRIGKSNDGGYLVNKNDINKTQTLISFGVGEDCSFEEQFTNITNCSCIAYDKSVTNVSDFFSGKNKLFSKNIGSDISFNEVISNHDKNVFLKCDIEGSEYSILNDIIRNDQKFSGIVIEFHDIEKHDNFNRLTNFISKINLKLVHIHGNNYFYYKREHDCILSVVELTFSSSENVFYNEQIKFPHNLDMTNNPNDNEFEIVF
jgi:hypothetical protein